MSKFLKGLKWLGLALVLIMVGLFIVVNVLTYQPLNSMYEQIESEVNETDDYFMVNGEDAVATIVYYPGGLVSAESYLLQASYLASENIRVIIPKMPFNLAILDRYAFNEIYNEDDHPWFLAGHSLGGASMAYVARDYPNRIAGLIFLAAYPPSSVDLKESGLNILSITASNDEVMNQSSFESTKALLPEATTFKEIVGGNHAQFGYYGSQRGDGEALISVYDQHQEVSNYIADFIFDVLDD